MHLEPMRSFLYLVLLLSGLLSCALGSSHRIVTAFTSGFKSGRSNVILEALLANPSREDTPEESVSVYTFKTNSTDKVGTTLQLTTIREPETLTASLPKSDLSMIYIDHADLFNENAMLARMQACFKSLLSPFNVTQHEDGGPTRRPFIVVLSGPAASAQLVERLLKEAWLLLDTEGLRNNGQAFSALDVSNLFRLFDVQIMLIPRSVPVNTSYARAMATLNPQAVQAVLRAVSSAAVSPNRTLEEVLNSTRTALSAPLVAVVELPAPVKRRRGLPFLTTTSINTTATVTAAPREDSLGIELASTAANVAFNSALKRANASAVELSALHTEPTGFAGVLQAMVANATHELRDYVSAHCGVGNASAVSVASLQWAERDLADRLYTRLLPLYKRQVALLKADAGTLFNKKVAAENMPITIHIHEDLLEAQEDTLRNFSTRAALLAPREAPVSLYNFYFEALELRQVIEEFVTDREHQYRALGVLPRGGNIGFTVEVAGRKVTFPPTEISFHLLAMHPLGRDYRQDVLGMRDTDRCFVAEGSAETADKGQWRRKLKTFAKNTANKLLNSQLTDKVLQESYIAKEDSAEVLRTRLKEKISVLEAELQAQQQQSATGGLLKRLSVRHLGRTLQLRHQLSKARKDGEFAREMMMLPLSLKNPDLGGTTPEPSPDTLPRRADKALKAEDAFAGEHLRSQIEDYGLSDAENFLRKRQNKGPERFIRWDLTPLDEAKRQLEQAKLDTIANAEKDKLRAWRRPEELTTDYWPGKDKFYKHPAINYGPEYRAQQESPVLPEFKE